MNLKNNDIEPKQFTVIPNHTSTLIHLLNPVNFVLKTDNTFAFQPIQNLSYLGIYRKGLFLSGLVQRKLNECDHIKLPQSKLRQTADKFLVIHLKNLLVTLKIKLGKTFEWAWPTLQ